VLRRAGIVLAVALGWTADARGQAEYAQVPLHVACGELFDPPCARVLPQLASQAARSGLDLRPVQTGGALDSVAVVCMGQTAAALVPRDAIAQMARQPACLGRLDSVGRPLFSSYAVLLVGAGGTARSLDDLARDGPRSIAAGPEGSGGQIALGFLRRANPLWERAISVSYDGFETALAGIAQGSIDGFFGMETLDGRMIEQARMRRDAGGGPLFRFIEVRPAPDAFRLGDGQGHCLYRLTALDFGDSEPVTTIAVDTMLLLGRGSRDIRARGGPPAVDVLASAIEQSQAGRDWRPVSTSCQ